MMEPDDFRACLISMGYDLVSTPPPRPQSPISALSCVWITYCMPPTFTSMISFPLHCTYWGWAELSHFTWAITGSER